MIFGLNTTSDISKLLYVISRAVRRVKFETILKYQEWYLCQISGTNHAIICLYYSPKRSVIFTCRHFKLSWNTTALNQSNCRNFSCSSITWAIDHRSTSFPGAAAQLCLFTSELKNRRNRRKARIRKTYCSMDVIYFLRIICRKKNLCLYP